jgi:hypothetical protein
MSGETTAPAGLDPTKPSVARMYDLMLGGKDNYASDRMMLEKVLTVAPETRDSARMNKEFGKRATRFIAQQGIRQYLDLGSGIPTSPPSTHDTARELEPDARVIYVDHDPVVVTHNRALRAISPGLVAISGDVEQPDSILASTDVIEQIDFREPVGVLIFSVLQTVGSYERAQQIVRSFAARMAPGSYLAMSHASTHSDAEAMAHVHKTSRETGYPPVAFRDSEQILGFFDGFDVVEPGLVDVRDWRPEAAGPAVTIRLSGAVGRKR